MKAEHPLFVVRLALNGEPGMVRPVLEVAPALTWDLRCLGVEADAFPVVADDEHALVAGISLGARGTNVERRDREGAVRAAGVAKARDHIDRAVGIVGVLHDVPFHIAVHRVFGVEDAVRHGHEAVLNRLRHLLAVQG